MSYSIKKGKNGQHTYGLGNINNRHFVVLASVCILGAGGIGDEGPDTIEVDDRAVELLVGLVEVSHTDLTEVTRVVLVEKNSVVMLTTGITTTTRVLSVLADTTMTGRNVTSFMAILLQSGGLHRHKSFTFFASDILMSGCSSCCTNNTMRLQSKKTDNCGLPIAAE